MSVQEIILQNSAGNLPATNRALGAAAMVLSPMLLIASFFRPADFNAPNENQVFASLGGVFYLLGAMAGATGARNLRVTGKSFGAAILYFVQIAGLFLAMWCDALEYAAPDLKETWIFFVTDMAYPFSHLLMLVVGIAIVRAGVWRGWRRIPAFAVGLALPSFIALSAAAGRENAGFIFPLFVTIGFFSFGLAIFTWKAYATENR